MTKPNLDGLLLPARAPKEDAPFTKGESADAQKSSAISFEHLGGKKILDASVAEPSESPIGFSHLYGESGGPVLSPSTESNSE